MGVCSRSLGMRCVNFWAPRRGLRGAPVGTAANALRANGLSPFLQTNNPLAEKTPQRMRSRREISPTERALTIWARLSRAFCASAIRRRDASVEMYMAHPAVAHCNFYARANLSRRCAFATDLGLRRGRGLPCNA